MSTYRKIHGRSIQAVTTDPTETVSEGQIWYNTSSDAFKTVLLSSTWASGANTTVTRGSGYGFGTLTAGVTGTGEAGPPGLVPTTTEEYNGNGWYNSGNYPTQVFLSNGCGTQTAGIVAGGRTPTIIANANVYNGSSWTAAGGNLNVAKSDGGMFGIQTSAIYCGGDNATPGYIADTELYDGSSWSEVNNLPVAKRQFGTAGTSTAGLISGGRIGPGPSVATTEDWDGTNWTTGPNINTARRYLQGWGSSTSALICGGSPDGTPGSALTEMYDGTSWSETGDLATGRHFGGTSQNQGSNTSGWMANGNAGPTFYSSTEEFDSSANVVTGGAWATIPNLNTSRKHGAGLGVQTSSLVCGGAIHPINTVTTNSEEYNGSSWSEGNNINNARRTFDGFGVQTAGVVVGGADAANTSYNYAEEYDGSSWTNATAVPYVLRESASAGTETAGLIFGGWNQPSPTGGPKSRNNTTSYDGSSWTSVNAMPFSLANLGGCGTSTAALYFGGYGSVPGNIPDNANQDDTASWDGTNWTTLASTYNMVKDSSGGKGYGTQSDASYVEGTSNFQQYNGTTWVTAPRTATSMSAFSTASAATASAGQVMGGDPGSGPRTNNVAENFTAGTTTLNVKTLTQS